MRRLWLFFVLLVLSGNVFAAADSYRWFHVTIETPWAIFIFLLPMVLFPAILMVILYWRYAGRKPVSRDNPSIQSKDN